MIDYFNKLPFRRKLIVINVLIILPVIIVGTILSIQVVNRNGQLAISKQVSAFGELTASYLMTDLLDNNKIEIETTLSNFERLPNVSFAAVLDNTNQIFANYGDIPIETIKPYLKDTSNRFQNNNLVYFKPIIHENKQLGTLFILNQTNQLQGILNKLYIGIIVASIFSFLVLMLASSGIQKLITRPIIKLVKIIEDIIKTGNYSKRIIENQYGDEIGILYDNFNHMLEMIDKTTVSQIYLDNVMSALAEMVIVLDEDGKINTINNAVTRLTDFTIHELKYQLPTVLIEDFIAVDKNTIFETKLLPKNQKTITVAVSVTTFINHEQKKRTILSIRDITEQKKAEIKLKENYTKLERTNHELKELSYILSHDLKAPIRGIGSLITMMEDDYKRKSLSKKMIADYFQLIQKRIVRMNSLINGILEFSKIGSQEVSTKSINLHQIVQEVIEVIVPENFEITVSEDLPTMLFNQIQMYQIFQNLIGNAVKYNDKPIGKIEVSWIDLGEKYQFKVKDNGIGIHPKYHDKIFKVFQMLEARDKVEGTGIGLAIVKKIIEKANGKIWIDSNYEVGVAFVFELPK